MKSILTVVTLLVFAVINVDLAFSQDNQTLEKMVADEELEQEFKWLKAETYVITASKVKETIKKAPASITVITDKQIRQMGARHLTDVLRTVPGMQPWYYFTGSYTYNARRSGGGPPSSNKVLILLNGHPLNSAYWGGATWVQDTLALDNVKRIEVLRGTGSALYGANAYIGVINVITKEAEDIDGVEFTARGGSYDTQQYNLLYGKTFNDLEVSFNFNYFKTHGFRGLIEEDFQTYFDQEVYPPGVPPVSLAPGRTNGDDEKYDAQLTLKYKGFTFDGRYVDRERDLLLSTAAALSNKRIQSDKNYYLNLSYENNVREDLELSGKVYANFEDIYWDEQVFPSGYITLTPNLAPPPVLLPAVMPEGMLVYGELKNHRIGVEFQAIYRINDKNTVVAGATYEELKQYDILRGGNYLPVVLPTGEILPPNTVIPLPSEQEWPNYFTEDTEKINFKAVFLEDIWDITENLRLTTGVRYDHYSNFGGEVSPRVGLTWEYVEGYDLKLLYGHAFQAPTFQQLYNIINGNPDLDPETKDGYAVSLGAEFSSSLSGRITGYYSKSKDFIVPNPNTPNGELINLGEGRGSSGFEVEVKYDFGRGTYIAGNYNYAGTPIGKIPTPPGTPTVETINWTTPRHMGNIMANIRLSRYLNLFTNCHFEDGFPRDIDDSRDDMSGYAIVDATLIARKFIERYEGLELRGSVYNLFDKDYTSQQDDRLPNDLPMPGINYLLEIKYEF